MIVIVAALKGGVGKTTMSVYLSAVSGARRATTLIDADPQASAADWLEHATDEQLDRLTVVEAPTERLLVKALARIGPDDIAVVDTPPGQERVLATAFGHADVVVVPTRVGGVETPRVEAVLDLVPAKVPVGLVFSSARTFTNDYQDARAVWAEAGVPVWGAVPERVTIAAGPGGWLSADGLDSYRSVWRRVLRAGRST